MENEQKCKITGITLNCACKIIGVISLTLAVLLTLKTLNGLGILGLFMTGWFCLMDKKVWCNSANCTGCCKPNNTECSVKETECDTVVKHKGKVEHKA